MLGPGMRGVLGTEWYCGYSGYDGYSGYGGYDGYSGYAKSWVRGFLGHSHTRGQHSGQRSSVASYQNIHGIILDDLVAASATKNAVGKVGDRG